MPADRDLQLADKGAKLVEEAMRLQGSISEELRRELGRLVRSMNCYYSNLIEGHPTHPVDIDRALAGKLSEISEKRNLQLEALAHIDVQAQIDAGKAPSPVMSVEFLTWTHRTFCEQLPEDLLWSPTLTPESAPELFQASFGLSTFVWVTTSHRRQPRSLPWLSGCAKPTRTPPSRVFIVRSPWRLLTTVCSGFIHSWMAMDVWPACFRMPCCPHRLIATTRSRTSRPAIPVDRDHLFR